MHRCGGLELELIVGSLPQTTVYGHRIKRLIPLAPREVGGQDHCFKVAIRITGSAVEK